MEQKGLQNDQQASPETPRALPRLLVRDAFSYSIQSFLSRPYFFVGLALVLVLVTPAIGSLFSSLVSFFGIDPAHTEVLSAVTAVLVVGVLVMVVVEILVWLGVVHLLITFYDTAAISFRQFFDRAGQFLNMFAGMVLYFLILFGLFAVALPAGSIAAYWITALVAPEFAATAVGMLFGIALFALGVVAALRFLFFGFSIVDQQHGAVRALKHSYRITHGAVLPLLGIVLVSAVLFLASLLFGMGVALLNVIGVHIVGIVLAQAVVLILMGVASAIALLAFVYAYRTLTSRS